MGLYAHARHIFYHCLILIGFFGVMGCGASVSPTSTAQSIFITATSTSLTTGATQAFIATSAEQAGTDISSVVNWSSSAPSVASISSTGVVTAQSVGTTTITASLSTVVSNSLVVTVRSVSSVAISAPLTTQSVGTSQQLTASATLSDSTLQSVPNLVTWTSSNPAILSISSAGLATANTIGVVTIQASYNGVSSNTLTLTITSSSVTVSSIVVTPGSPLVVLGNTKQLKATAINSDGSTSIVTAFATWSSAATGIATVSSTGLASTVAVGSATISATYGGVTGSVFFVVKSAYGYLYTNATGASVGYCSLSASGVISGCGTTAGAYSSGSTIFNGNYAYITHNSGGTHQVIVCNVNTGTGVLSGCGVTGSGYGAITIGGIAFYGAFAYLVSNNTGNLYVCPYTASTGALGACSLTASVASQAFQMLTVNGNYLYATNGNSGLNVFFCAINTTTGALSNCAPTGSIQNTVGITFAGDYAYMNSFALTTVSVCTVNANGTLYPCQNTGTASQATALANDGTHLYISNYTAWNITTCNISAADGTLSGCATSAPTLSSNLWGIGVN